MVGNNSIKSLSMHVIIIHRYFWPENVAVLPLMLKEVVSLHTKKGHKVTVVCGRSKNFDTAWNETFSDNVKFRYFTADIDRQKGTLGRILNSLKLTALAIKSIVSCKNLALVYLVSYPPLFAGLILFATKYFKRKAKYIYYVQDNHKYLIKNKLLLKLFDAYSRAILKGAHAILTLSESMKIGLVECFRPKAAELIVPKIHVVENYSTDLLTTHEFSRVEKEYDIIYAGNHGVAQNLSYFFELIDIANIKPQLHIKFYGDGTEKEKLLEVAKNSNAVVEFEPPVSRELISHLISKAKYGLVAAQPDLTRYAHPSKLAAYNSAGTKALVMCEPDSMLADWLTSTGMGFGIDPRDKDKAANQLTKIFTKEAVDYSASDLIADANRMYSKDSYLLKLENVIDQLLDNTSHDMNEVERNNA